MKTPSSILCTTFLCLFAASAMATNGIAYKCTAEDGRISFLDKKPTEGCATVEVVKIYGANTSKDVSSGGLEDLATQQQQQDEKAIAEREEQTKKDCTMRAENLKVLKTQNRVIVTDPTTGEKKPLSATEQQEQINKNEEYIQMFCTEKK